MGKVDISKAKEPHHSKKYPKDKYPKDGGDDELELVDRNENGENGENGESKKNGDKNGKNSEKNNIGDMCMNTMTLCLDTICNADIITNVVIVVVIMIIIYFIYTKSKSVNNNVMEYFDGNRSKKQERTDIQGTTHSSDGDWNLSEKITNLINRQNKLVNKTF
jgi:hypothetical protein